ncbi:MAG: peptide-methionine (R)-S-oxide reductase MsrB [Candidatus Heimdallarchaeota archaeon]|nr:peptide-methionine (R)-S-oxide reductase MsrB [Candidatus Heimdallarchaeota archaeon]
MERKEAKNDKEWKLKLTPEQYNILRLKGTEQPFTGEYWDHKEKGIYKCAGCGITLFTSETKYDSGCGWPSFFEPEIEENIEKELDLSNGMRRIEVLCKNCGGHLGHLFDDGPQPTGMRYCINSVSIDFEKKE